MRGDALSLFEKSSAKAFLLGCSPIKLFLELYIYLIGLQPSKEVFCQAFFQKSGNRVLASPRISPTNHNLTTQYCFKSIELFFDLCQASDIS